ncbi:DUF1302 domain-containing protein [Patescibacteria group bacterium]|nr:DUF1302 domain-containing protein [Patescibacteria group bacterium]
MKKIKISILALIILLLSGNNLVAANIDGKSYFNFTEKNSAEIIEVKLNNFMFSDYIFSGNTRLKSFAFTNKKGEQYLVVDINNCVFPKKSPHYRNVVDGKIVSRIAISQFTPTRLRIALRLEKMAKHSISLNKLTNSLEIHVSSAIEEKFIKRTTKQGVEILINGNINLMKEKGKLKAIQLWGKSSIIVFVERQSVFYKYLMYRKTEQILCEKAIADNKDINRYKRMFHSARGVKSKERQEKFARILEKIENHEKHALLKLIEKKPETEKMPLTSAHKELSQKEAGKPVEKETDQFKTAEKEYKISGKIKNETACRFNDGAFSKIKNILELNSSGKISQDLSYTLGGRTYYDAIFGLTDNYSEKIEDDQEKEIELRDAYVDFSAGNFDLRIGKQQIVWGEAIGVFIADVVHPWDLREYILPELGDMRMSEWTANIEWYPAGNHFQFVWIPFPEYSKLGGEGSEFDFLDRETKNIKYGKEKEPSNNLRNSKIGFKANRFFDDYGLDLSLFWLNKHDDLPIPFREIAVDPLTYSYSVNINPKYERINVFGAAFSKDIKDDIVKGEFVYNKGKYFQVDNLNDKDGVAEKDSLDYLLGWDHTFFRKIDFNLQFMQRIIFGHEKEITEDKIKSSISVWIKTGFLNNIIEPELTGIFSIDRTDYLLRPKINYNLSDSWKIVGGADIFEGEPESRGDFGRFEKNNRAYIEASYDF